MKVLLLSSLAASVMAGCPYLESQNAQYSSAPSSRGTPEFYAALSDVPLDDVKADLMKLYVASDIKWPADYGTYAPFFIRLAWHCSGSYRISDGRGGCSGGRQRFDPERSWDDNTNLDKARSLLEPIKLKYGFGLSWGDLFILAGTTAIESMGGPSLGVCLGRVDDVDGSASLPLGPTAEQEVLAPCPTNGECEGPLGTTTVGLIYVNPEGPMGKPDPVVSSTQVRDTFARMAMNDTETVALIGGGHAFGKTHGACPESPGLPPSEDEENPWSGNCGSGVGVDAVTSGFEGPWTANPTAWDNYYFKNLLNYDWSVHEGPGGHFQWKVSPDFNATSPSAPSADGEGEQDVMMLTSDISLINDKAYFEIVSEFASDLDLFSDQFAHAWYKLTTRDMGPVTRCNGPATPLAQPFQYPLPPTPSPHDLPDFSVAAKSIEDIIASDPDASSLLIKAAWSCAKTFRDTDFLGGCNGGRIRFVSDEWPEADEIKEAVALLTSLKDSDDSDLSFSDLLVLAGTTALSKSLPSPLRFCGGRTDATVDDGGYDYLFPRITGGADDDADVLMDVISMSGLAASEYVAVHTASTSLDLEALLTHDFELDGDVYKAVDADIYVTKTDIIMKTHAELHSIVVDLSSNPGLLTDTLATAWPKAMSLDLFDVTVGENSPYCM